MEEEDTDFSGTVNHIFRTDFSGPADGPQAVEG
jgi:hypothetical protein